MSDCGVCIGGDFDGSCDFSETRIVKSRKEFRCEECSRTIPVGSMYEYHAGKWDGDFITAKTCMECREIAIAFSCNGSRIMGCLWEDMRDYVFPDMTTTCFERLQTSAAKSFLRHQWMNWKGITA